MGGIGTLEGEAVMSLSCTQIVESLGHSYLRVNWGFLALIFEDGSDEEINIPHKNRSHQFSLTCVLNQKPLEILAIVCHLNVLVRLVLTNFFRSLYKFCFTTTYILERYNSS